MYPRERIDFSWRPSLSPPDTVSAKCAVKEITVLVSFFFLKHFKRSFIIYLKCMSVLFACIYVHHIHVEWPQRLEVGVRSLELELCMIENHHVGVGNWNRVFCDSKC